jgi:signal transduction histidine kinase
MRINTLKVRLGVGLGLSLIATAALFLFLVTDALRDLLEGYLESRLARDAEVLLTAVDMPPGGPPGLQDTHLDNLYNQPFSGRYFRIDIGETTLRSRSLWDTDLTRHTPPPGQPQLLRSDGPRQQSLLVYAATYRKLDQTVVVAVGEDIARIDDAVAGLQRDYLFMVVIVAAVLVILQTFVVTRSLRPLEFVRQRLRDYQKGESGEIRVSGPGEILPLVEEINRLGEVTRRRLQRHRRALGNLAHALKTPLTLLTQLSDRDTDSLSSADRALLRNQTAAVEKLVQRELRRARFAAGTTSGGPGFEADSELNDLIAVLRRMYAEKSLVIQLNVETADRVPLDREDMLELFGNLLDNACKWATGTVVVHVAIDTVFVIEVDDDGPGCPEDQLKELTRRGIRLDEQPAGHGLGLAIVKDLVEDYDGNIEFGRSVTLGGLSVRVQLPLESEQV